MSAHACIEVHARLDVRAIQGIALDDSQQPIVGLTVTLLKGKKGEREIAKTTTDEHGGFLFDTQKPGDYVLRFEERQFHVSQVAVIRLKHPVKNWDRGVIKTVSVLGQCGSGNQEKIGPMENTR